MLSIKSLLPLIIILGFCFSCKKDSNNLNASPVSVITIVNAVPNSSPMIADLLGADSVAEFYQTTTQIGYGSFNEYTVQSGNVPAVVFQTLDTTNALYRGNIDLQPHSLYTLFLMGTLTGHNAVDTLLTLDHPPYHGVGDSTVGIRFANLSAGSHPMAINIQGNSLGSEVMSMPYKGVTDFRIYPATMDITQYVFEIRDTGSDSLLTSFTYNLFAFQNITIAVIGQEGPTSTFPINAIQINNY